MYDYRMSQLLENSMASAKVDAKAWCAKWMSDVTGRPASMTQRKLSSIESKGGGLRTLKKHARASGVHLLQLTDDRGDTLVAASTKVFRVLA